MAKKSLTITDLPPFPKLVWDDDDLNWKATIVLNSWRGFQSRGGPYGGVDSTVPSDGTITLLVNPGDDEEETPPFAEQSAAFQHLLENEQVIHDQIVKAIFERYPKLRAKLQKQMKEMLECKMIKKKYHDEFLSQMPEISKPSELLRMMGLSHVHVLNVHHDGMAYVGFEMGCCWEEEHGLGIMTHSGRIVELGDAETSSYDEVAKKDRRKMKKGKKEK